MRLSAQDLHAAIVAELDRLEKIEREATPGKWDTTNYGEVYDHDGYIAKCCGSTTGERLPNARLIATSRNLFPGMIAYIRQRIAMVYAGYKMCEMNYKKKTGPDWVRLMNKADDYTRELESIAKALGIEVKP